MIASPALSSKEKAVRLISRIQSESISQLRQRRECGRTQVFLPGKVRFLDRSAEFEALIRDLSSDGVGLITTKPVRELDRAEIELAVSEGCEVVAARCCWCRALGGFFLSGWEFTSELE